MRWLLSRFALSIYALTIIAVGIAWAANTKLSSLGAATTISGTNRFYCVQSDGSGGVSCLASQVAAFVFSLFSNDCTASGTGTVTCTKTNGVNFAATATSAAESSVTFTDITTNNVSTAKHGFAPKAPNDGTKYLDGTGAYTVPVAGQPGQVIHPGYIAGDYYPPYPFTSGAGTAVTANEFRCIPWVPVTTSTTDVIRNRTSTLATGGLEQIFIYASLSSTKWPTGTPLATTGQFSTDTPVGNKDGSFTVGTGNSGSNFQVTAGTLYFLCQNFNNSTNVFVTGTTTNGQVAYLLGSPTASFLSTTDGMVLRYAVGTTFGTTNVDLTGVTPVELFTTTYGIMIPHITSVP